jgi:cell division protease FtsH
MKNIMKWLKKHLSLRIISMSGTVLVVLVIIIANLTSSKTVASVSTDVGIRNMKEYSKVDSVVVNDYVQSVVLKFKDKQSYKDGDKTGKYDEFIFNYTTGQRDDIAKILNDSKYKNGYKVIRQSSNLFLDLVMSIIPTLLLFGIMYWIYAKQMGGGIGKKNVIASTEQHVRFDDVKGEDTAVDELLEIKDMMVNPDAYKASGAHMPKGILLYGPPGTGKTLLAKALAGETKSSFYYTNGSSFVEMFVGLGAKRVRSLFETARDNTPAIIFIDEIDAVGGSRGRTSNSEAEQTLNQLLVEMDGFESNGQLLIIAATNRPDMLDKALLRPGRFDRQVSVDMPDMKGREDILSVHSANKKIGDDVDLHWAAQQTSGFSGAQLANVMNEAAVMSVRNKHEKINQDDISEGIDRVMAGPQKNKRNDYKNAMKHTAYHEGGHAIVAMSLKQSNPVTKVTILPRGRALGYTMISPNEDETNYTESQIKAQLAYMMGGKAAEEMIFGESSTGAGSDIEKATSLARDAIQKYGFSKSIGLGSWSDDSHDGIISEATKSKIDQEVSDLLTAAFITAKKALDRNRDSLDVLVNLLVEKETVENNELNDIKNSVDIIQ